MVGQGIILAAQRIDSCMTTRPRRTNSSRNKPFTGGTSALRGDTVMMKSAELICLVDGRLKLLDRLCC